MHGSAKWDPQGHLLNDNLIHHPLAQQLVKYDNRAKKTNSQLKRSIEGNQINHLKNTYFFLGIAGRFSVFKTSTRISNVLFLFSAAFQELLKVDNLISSHLISGSVILFS